MGMNKRSRPTKSEAPEDSDRAPGEPANGGEHDSRTNRPGSAGAHDLTDRYHLVGRDNDGTKE
jgi:hypothetical protein